jgi:cytochrome c oxidase cbb3-type subunit 3
VSTDPTAREKIVHVYDDIEEEDNQLPRWWLFILFGTIVFGFGYWFVYHTARLRPTPNVAYRAEVQALLEARIRANPASPEAVLAMASDAGRVAEGREVFMTTCAACHGQEGEGVIGPNLTDRYWIHGATPAAILTAAVDGFPAKGMPAWGPILGPDQAAKAAAFVLTLKGRNLPGKPPQGEAIE